MRQIPPCMNPDNLRNHRCRGHMQADADEDARWTLQGPAGDPGRSVYCLRNRSGTEQRDGVMAEGRRSYAEAIEGLVAFAEAFPRLAVLTGAGVSTDSGIPDYRGEDGRWKHRRPVMYQDFVHSETVRRRYWGRSVVGWRRVDAARPGAAHRALARLEGSGRVRHLITQNVDGLHQRGGSRAVTDLHGRLDTVECLDCGAYLDRDTFQTRLEALNPDWAPAGRTVRPDGDADLPAADYERFAVPACGHCGGILKPAVVFFGENVPRPRVAGAMDHLAEADALLVVGSSLMVFSGYRFVREAVRLGKPVALVNRGRTRADEEVGLKLDASCGQALAELAARVA